MSKNNFFRILGQGGNWTTFTAKIAKHGIPINNGGVQVGCPGTMNPLGETPLVQLKWINDIVPDKKERAEDLSKALDVCDIAITNSENLENSYKALSVRGKIMFLYILSSKYPAKYEEIAKTIAPYAKEGLTGYKSGEKAGVQPEEIFNKYIQGTYLEHTINEYNQPIQNDNVLSEFQKAFEEFNKNSTKFGDKIVYREEDLKELTDVIQTIEVSNEDLINYFHLQEQIENFTFINEKEKSTLEQQNVTISSSEQKNENSYGIEIPKEQIQFDHFMQQLLENQKIINNKLHVPQKIFLALDELYRIGGLNDTQKEWFKNIHEKVYDHQIILNSNLQSFDLSQLSHNLPQESSADTPEALGDVSVYYDEYGEAHYY